MSKSHEEIAGEVVQAVIAARGKALSGIGSNNAAVANNALGTFLGKGAVIDLYRDVIKTIQSSQ